MISILVPTDFSALSQNAFDLANVLGDRLQADIHLLHVVPGPQGVYYDENGLIIEDEGIDLSQYYAQKNEMEDVLTRWVRDKDNVSSYLVRIGHIEEDIVRYVKDNNIDFVVMGTQGTYGEETWIGGSHTQRITTKVGVPVLSLKCNRDDIDLNEIVLVSDFTDEKAIDLSVLKAIQGAFQSRLRLLRIVTPGKKNDLKAIQEMMDDFVQRNQLANVTSAVFEDSDVESGIGRYCAEHHIDLIALGTHQKKGLSKLFRKNISDNVVNHLFHPILTFPIGR